jgi:hypothetical protein
MIAWFNLLGHFLWLLGLALLLTAVSLVQWQAEQVGRSSREAFAEPAARLAVAAGFFVLALGLALVLEPWGYKASWLGFMLLAGWLGLAAWRQRRRVKP